MRCNETITRTHSSFFVVPTCAFSGEIPFRAWTSFAMNSKSSKLMYIGGSVRIFRSPSLSSIYPREPDLSSSKMSKKTSRPEEKPEPCQCVCRTKWPRGKKRGENVQWSSSWVLSTRARLRRIGSRGLSALIIPDWDPRLLSEAVL
jgi:hypothetical protein